MNKHLFNTYHVSKIRILVMHDSFLIVSSHLFWDANSFQFLGVLTFFKLQNCLMIHITHASLSSVLVAKLAIMQTDESFRRQLGCSGENI